MAMMGDRLSSPIWALMLILPFAFAQVSSFPTDSSKLLYSPGDEVYYLETTQLSLDRIPLFLQEMTLPGSDTDRVGAIFL